MGRNNFRKEMKMYEKKLKCKAKLGILSFSEKEEYARICRNKYRNRQFGFLKSKEVLGGMIIIAGLVLVNSGVGIEQLTQMARNILKRDYPVQVTNPFSSGKHALIEEINFFNTTYQASFKLYGELIAYYNSARIINQEKLTELRNKTITSHSEQLMPLAETLKACHNKQIVILEYLSITDNVDINYANKLQEDIKQLEQQYNLQLNILLENEGIAQR